MWFKLHQGFFWYLQARFLPAVGLFLHGEFFCCWWESPEAARPAPPGRSSMSFMSPANRLFMMHAASAYLRACHQKPAAMEYGHCHLEPSLIADSGWGSCFGLEMF